MSDTAVRLLEEAESGEAGRRALFALCNEAKEAANACTFLALSLHKFARDESVSCATMAFDTVDEKFVFRSLHAAQSDIAAARERVTKLYLAALKDSGRV